MLLLTGSNQCAQQKSDLEQISAPHALKHSCGSLLHGKEIMCVCVCQIWFVGLQEHTWNLEANENQVNMSWEYSRTSTNVDNHLERALWTSYERSVLTVVGACFWVLGQCALRMHGPQPVILERLDRLYAWLQRLLSDTLKNARPAFVSPKILRGTICKLNLIRNNQLCTHDVGTQDFTGWFNICAISSPWVFKVATRCCKQL
jgi:hypothetical protein